MSVPKLHHIIPKFHLRRFTNSADRLWAWDKQADRVFMSTPNRVAAEKHFYRLANSDAVDHDPLEMEHQLSRLEANMAAITTQWLEWLPDMAPLDRMPIPRENRTEVALFLAVQFLRTRDTREILSSLIETHCGSRPGVDEELQLHTELMWNQGLVEPLARRFRRSIWIFGRNLTDIPFITSDNPITVRTSDNRRWLRGGILVAATYTAYPLSPSVILYCHPPQSRFRALKPFVNAVSPVTFTPSMVRSENSGQAFMATRFVISNRADFEAEQNYIVQNQ